MKPHSYNWLNKYIPKLNQIKATIEVWLDCTTNGCDYTRRGTSRLRKGGDLAAIADDIESGIETSDIVSPDSQLFLTLEKNCIFVHSLLSSIQYRELNHLISTVYYISIFIITKTTSNLYKLFKHMSRKYFVL